MTKSPRLLSFIFLTVVVFVSGSWTRLAAQTDSLSVQVASYLKAADAQAAVNRLKAKKLDAYWVKAEIPGMGTRYRVRIGRYTGEEDATLGAAEACKTRAVANYLIADGENVPVGVPAKTCKSAIEFAARLSSKSEKAGQLAAKTPTGKEVKAGKEAKEIKEVKEVTPTKEMASAKEVAAPKTVKAPVMPETTVASSKAPEKAKTKSAATKETTATKEPVTPAVPEKAASATIPAPKPAKPVLVTPPAETTAKTTAAGTNPPAPTKSNAVAFVPAATPREIVSNAYKYATAKAGNATASLTSPLAKPETGTASELDPAAVAAGVDSLLARSAGMPGSKGNVAIANPKWKVSEGSIADNKNLRAVHFVNPKTGWAAGEAGAIYQTSDGGKQWNLVPSASLTNTAVDVNRIYFVDEKRGWMLAESKDKAQGRTILLSTEDGGKIWQHFELPNVTSFFFVDGKSGWAVGKNSTMLRTADGGMKWKPIENLNRLVGLPVESASSTFGFSDVYFLKNGEIGWAVGNFYGTGTSNIGGLFMTMNGGESWQRIPIAVQRKTNSTRFTKGKLHSVRFTDASNGVITGEMEDGEDHFFFTLKTRNGGETWEQARIASSGLHSTQFVNGAQGWTAASARRKDAAGARTYDTVLLRTDNGGRTWVTDFIAKGKQIRSVYFLSPNRGWAVGDQGMVLRYEAQ